MTTTITETEVAKIVKAELKKAFPAVKFSVKTSKYSGGSSIHVRWIDGPTGKQVEAVASKYHGAEFDGMIDLKEYVDSELNGQPVRFANDFIFFEREHSDNALLAACEAAKKFYGDLSGFEFVPSKVSGRWTHSAHISGGDYQTEQKIYEIMRSTAF